MALSQMVFRGAPRKRHWAGCLKVYVEQACVSSRPVLLLVRFCQQKRKSSKPKDKKNSNEEASNLHTYTPLLNKEEPSSFSREKNLKKWIFEPHINLVKQHAKRK